MCCHIGMSCRRQRTQHPTPSQYTNTGPSCCCAINWSGMSYQNTQLPTLMSFVRPDQEIILRPSTHQRTLNSIYDAFMVVARRKLGRKYCTNWVLNPGHVVCESITLSARPQLLPTDTWTNSSVYIISYAIRCCFLSKVYQMVLILAHVMSLCLVMMGWKENC